MDTKGPWKKEWSKSHKCWLIIDSNDNHIATIVCDDDDIASLIESAPALKQAIQDHDSGRDDFYCWSVQDVVDEAMAKGE